MPFSVRHPEADRFLTVTQVAEELATSEVQVIAMHQRRDIRAATAPRTCPRVRTTAPAVATDDSGQEDEDYKNKSWGWGGTMRVSGGPRPVPIEDEKSRRDNIKPS